MYTIGVTRPRDLEAGSTFHVLKLWSPSSPLSLEKWQDRGTVRSPAMVPMLSDHFLIAGT